ncbi:PH domain-containing protein [bacterium]|nr:PH domain-containing protein [bacterium]
MLSIYRLPNKLPNEKIIKVIRRDIFILFKKIVMFLGLILLPVIFFYFFIYAQPGIFNGTLSYPLIVLGTSAYFLFVWLFFFFSFIDYYLDVWIITNERIIDIEQRGFFSRIIAEHKLFRVQDVTSEVHGFFPTILKYGDVHIQTAGVKQRFHFHQVPNPNEIRDKIIKLIQRKKKEMQKEIKHDLRHEGTSYQ